VRLGLGAVVLLLAVAILGGAQAQAAAKRPPCKPRGTRTQAKRSGTRVFIRDGTGANGPYRVTYACRYATKRVFKLGIEWENDFTTGSIDSIELNGPFVSWTQQFEYVDELSEEPFSKIEYLGLSNLKTGRKESVSAFSIHDSALTPRGSLAWIEVPYEPEASETEISEVWSLVAGVRTKLDSGPSGAIGALVARGGTLTWTNSGAIKEAPMP
jgi:hypothetical protein